MVRRGRWVRRDYAAVATTYCRHVRSRAESERVAPTRWRRDRARHAVHALRAAVVLLAAEGLLLVALGMFLVVRGFGADTDDRGRAELGGLLAVVAGVVLWLLAGALLAHRRWARSPLVVVQMLCLPVGVGLLQAHRYGEGIPLVVVPVGVLVLIGLAGGYRPRQPPGPGDPLA
ncbi:putative membrane protein [Candidatus Protofrankia californiensis]|uniref:Putative membrane protein n=1 Tax=Candidatus Protofrankia californiensis TaxID=1839754 RepID=A0A1C3NVT5_9ACTN|nr:putative membrane protein [Candidatus Protofrankia californiensis]